MSKPKSKRAIALPIGINADIDSSTERNPRAPKIRRLLKIIKSAEAFLKTKPCAYFVEAPFDDEYYLVYRSGKFKTHDGDSENLKELPLNPVYVWELETLLEICKTIPKLMDKVVDLERQITEAIDVIDGCMVEWE